MKNWLMLALGCLVLATGSACKKTKSVPVIDKLRQVWGVKTAQENGTTVYVKGGTSNTKPAYSRYKLDLKGPDDKTVRLTEIDQNFFTGTWTLSSDTKTLTLNGLYPEPSGSGGTITYAIEGEISDSQLTLLRTELSPKTGAATTRYELVKL